MRILMLGAGVIGSVYATKLAQAGHDIVVVARGRRLADLREHGLVTQVATKDGAEGQRTVLRVPVVAQPAPGSRFDVVVVSVRADQFSGTVPTMAAMADRSDVLFFGNAAGQTRELRAALGRRALFGFPAVGGVLDGDLVRYVLIGRQKTTLGEAAGGPTAAIRRLGDMFQIAGFPTRISPDMDAWLMAHAAFIVPIGCALLRVGVVPTALASDAATLRLMVQATREAFGALRSIGNREVPRNLRLLYRLPTPLVQAYWRRVLAGPRGELWFGAHTRHAPEEVRDLAMRLRVDVAAFSRPTPALDRLLTQQH